MIWIVIVSIGVLTFAMRLSFIVMAERLIMTPKVQLALEFVPIAVFTAIIIPALLLHPGSSIPSFTSARLIAGIIAIIVAWRTRSVFATIASGMFILWICQFAFGLHG